MAVSLSLLAGAGWQFFDDNGNPLSGGLLYTYEAGTTTPLATYTDSNGNVANANPIVLDAAGRVPYQVWLNPAYSYKFILKTSLLLTVWTEDNVPGYGSSADILFLQSGTGAVVRTVQSKLRDTVSVKDFGAVGDGVADDTAAFTAAQGTSLYSNRLILVPAGTYKLNNLRLKSGAVFQGEGYTSTIIQQANTTNPAIYGLADASTGQLVSCGLLKLRVKGLGTAGAPAVKLEATAPYVVSFGDYDFHAEAVSTALELVVAGANEVYSNKFNIICVGAASTAFITEGVYNEYRLEAVLCASGKMLQDTSLKSTFYYCVGDGTLEFGGQMCTAINPTVETIAAASAFDNCAIRVAGYDNTLINPVVAEVAASKALNAFNIFNNNILINPRILGTDKPNFPFVFSTLGSTSTLIGGNSVCPNKIEAYTNVSTIRALNLVGDVSTYSLKVNSRYPASPYVSGTSYTIDGQLTSQGLDDAIIIGSSGTCTLTLPSGSGQIGRELTVISRVAQVVQSASANVVPPTGGSGTAILAATVGKWARLKYDGTNWTIIANN